MSVIISLCDITGHMVQPWVEAGYDAILVDPQHGETRWDGEVFKFAGTVEEAMSRIGQVARRREIAAVFGFPPCTDMCGLTGYWGNTTRRTHGSESYPEWRPGLLDGNQS